MNGLDCGRRGLLADGAYLSALTALVRQNSSRKLPATVTSPLSFFGRTAGRGGGGYVATPFYRTALVSIRRKAVPIQVSVHVINVKNCYLMGEHSVPTGSVAAPSADLPLLVLRDLELTPVLGHNKAIFSIAI